MTKRYLLANMIFPCHCDMSWNPGNHNQIIRYNQRHFTVIVSGILLTFFKRSPLTAFVYEHGCEENAYKFNYLINLMRLHGQITFQKLPLSIVYISFIFGMYFAHFVGWRFGNANMRNHILNCNLVLYLICHFMIIFGH